MRVAKANLMPFHPGGVQAKGWDETLHVVVGVSGSGTLTIGGTPYEIKVGDVLVIPWSEAVAYVAHKKDGLTIASIHLVPRTENVVEGENYHHRDLGQVRARLPPAGLPKIPMKKSSASCLPNVLDVALGIVDTWSLETVHST